MNILRKWTKMLTPPVFALLVLCLSVGIAVAADDFYLQTQFRVKSLLINNKSTYGNDRFDRYLVFVGCDRTKTEGEDDAVGTFTIKSATFDWTVGFGNTIKESVEGKDKTFELHCSNKGDTSYLEFVPMEKNDSSVYDWITFIGRSETGLPGKTIEWNILGQNFTGTVHEYKNLEEQKVSFVPYVELIADASGTLTGVTWRFVKPNDPATAVSVPAGAFHIRLSNGTSDIFRTSTAQFYSAGIPGGTLAIPAGIKIADVKEAQFRYKYTKAQYYVWRFIYATPTASPTTTPGSGGSGGGCNAGFAAWGILALMAPLFFLGKRAR